MLCTLLATSGAAMATPMMEWKHCHEGMQMTQDKGCQGKALRLNYVDAQAYISKLPPEGWRMPTVVELKHYLGNVPHSLGVESYLWTSTTVIQQEGTNMYNYTNIQKGVQYDVSRLTPMRWAVHSVTKEARGDASRKSELPLLLVRMVP